MNRNYDKQKNKFITINTKNKIFHICIEKIIYVTCDGYVSTIHTESSEATITVSRLLKLFEIDLLSFDFIRVNNSTIVNLKYIISLQLGKRSIILLQNCTEISVSRRRKKMVYDVLTNNIGIQ